MVFDWQRTMPLLGAIKKRVCRGDVVVDIGCGLGILSFAAALAGAKRVYAIDCDLESLEFAKWEAKKLGLKQIIFFGDHSFNIELREKCDCLIQETVGPLAFDENFLPTLLDARRRFLKPRGKIIPETLMLYGAPVEKNRRLLSPPTLLKKIETKTSGLKNISLIKTWKIKKSPAGVLLWPKIVWTKNFETDASPLASQTHWGQTFFSLKNHKKKSIKLELKISPDPENPAYYSETLWRVT